MTARVTRTYDYDSRTTDVALMMSVPGIEYLRGILRGDFPGAPIASTLGFTLAEVDPGRAVFTGVPERFVYNPLGGVHGGWAATLLDSAMGCAVHTTLPLGQAYTSLETKVNFLRPVSSESGVLRAHGWVTKPGRRAAFAEADLRDASGTILATASSTCAVFPVS
jgi:uncharacterized protein (TIGR00369 family)